MTVGFQRVEAGPGAPASAAPPLGVSDLIVHRRSRSARPVRIGRVQYGLPSCHQISDAGEARQLEEHPGDGAARRLGVRARFAFDPLSRSWDSAALFLRIFFDDQRIQVLDAQVEGWSAAASISGLRSNAVGWFFDEQGGGGTPPEVLVYAVLDIPGNLPILSGTLRAEMPVVRRGLLPGRKAHASTPGLQEFAVPLPDRGPGADTPAVTGSAGAGRPVEGSRPAPAVRLCIAADIERYRRFRTPEAVRAQQRLVDVLARARERTRLDETQVETQATGDGLFAVLPAGLDESEVIPSLVRELGIALAEVNSDLNEHARLRIRIALHRGLMHRGPNGWAGDSAIGVHRILDSAPARQALVDHQEADFVLIVPDTLYRDVIVHGYGLLQPDAFTMAEVEMPAKDFADRVWVYVPGTW